MQSKTPEGKQDYSFSFSNITDGLNESGVLALALLVLKHLQLFSHAARNDHALNFKMLKTPLLLVMIIA